MREAVGCVIIPPLANGVKPISRPARAASIPTEAAVPNPGTVLAAPDTASRAAPVRSPAIARSAANNRPAPNPTRGIFLRRPFPNAFAPSLAAPFVPALVPALVAALVRPRDPALLAKGPPRLPLGSLGIPPKPGN